MQPEEIAGFEYEGLEIEGNDPFWSSLTFSEDECDHDQMDDEAPDM